MTCQLVIQFDAKSSKDFQHLVAYDKKLVQKLGDSATVDGNDFGMGKFNFFIFTDDPAGTLDAAMEIFQRDTRNYNIRAAYREVEGETYIALWPPGLKDFEVL